MFWLLWLVYSTLIGPFEFERERPLILSVHSNFEWTNQIWGGKHLASDRCRGLHHKHLRKAEEANFKGNLSFFASLSTAEGHGFEVKFIGLMELFIAIRDFSLWGESDLWSDVWLAMDGVVCLSILLEGGVTVSNNFTKRRQNGFKIGARDKFTTHLREENFISNEIVIYPIFFTIGDFPVQFSVYTSCHIHHVFWAWRACGRYLCWSPLLDPSVTDIGQFVRDCSY